jgi:hypothetical protein
MTRRQAQRARAIARQMRSYREWATDPTFGAIPSISVISDPRLHARQAFWELRRAENGVFDAPQHALIS